jgi:hypothetical protein
MATMSSKKVPTNRLLIHRKPSYGAPAIYVPLFGGVYLAMGSFVMLRGNEEDMLVVAQLLKATVPTKTVCINRFCCVDGSSLVGSIPCLSGIAQDSKEVYQTQDFPSIPLSDITNIAFVFSPSEMQENGYVIEGIANAFVCRYREDGNLACANYCFSSNVPNYCCLSPQK